VHFQGYGTRERTKSDRRGDLLSLGKVKPIDDEVRDRISGSMDVMRSESWKE
jgi:hypothetical protein